ncbi:MAG: MmcQ/YjbR family DNA-binding protein [Sciscionella sp.]
MAAVDPWAGEGGGARHNLGVITTEQVREIVLALPETVERLAWGRPCFLVDEKIFTSIRDGDTELSVKVTDDNKAALVADYPDTFSVPAHYARSPMFVVQLATVDEARLRALLTDAWRMTAPERLLANFNSAD